MRIETGRPCEIDRWMELVVRVRDHFPGLETPEALEEHRCTVLRFMSENRALCAKDGETLLGILLFSVHRNQICFLAVAPECRRSGVGRALMTEALKRLDRSRPVSVVTYREGDPLGTAARPFYRACGFTEGELHSELGHPVQTLILPPAELWDAYDREGRLTGGILVRDEPIPDGLCHLVCDVLVRHRDGSFLCMKRAMSKRGWPGCYEATAGGSALRGETPLECVQRELREETGIECEHFEEVARAVAGTGIYYSYVCEVDCDKSSVRLQEGETEDYRWMSPTEFAEFVRSDRMIEPQKQRYTEYFRRIGIL